MHAGHRAIEGSKARARLVVNWPQINNDIENSCRSCQEREKDLPSNPAQPLKHLPAPNYPFEFIAVDWFDLNGDKFLVLVDWYSGYFEVKGPVNSPDAVLLFVVCVNGLLIMLYVIIFGAMEDPLLDR